MGRGPEPFFTEKSLNHTIGREHAPDFGVLGNQSNATRRELASAIQGHINDPDTRVIFGRYYGDPRTIYFNERTGLAVVTHDTGEFVVGFKLYPSQVRDLIETGGFR